MSPLVPGMEISHFRLLEKLGAGASGEVFRAEHVHLHRPVAMKFLTRAETPEQQERFLSASRKISSVIFPR